MKDTDPANLLSNNPYASPPLPKENIKFDDSVEFDTIVVEDDIVRGMGKRFWLFVIVVILFAPEAWFYFRFPVMPVLVRPIMGWAVLLVSVMAGASLMYLVYWRLSRIVARRQTRKNPKSLGAVKGTITRDWFVVQTTDWSAKFPTGSLLGARVNGDVLSVWFNSSLPSNYFLPRRAFGGNQFQEVATWYSSTAKANRGLRGIRARLLERREYVELECLDEGIPFGGELSYVNRRASQSFIRNGNLLPLIISSIIPSVLLSRLIGSVTSIPFAWLLPVILLVVLPVVFAIAVPYSVSPVLDRTTEQRKGRVMASGVYVATPHGAAIIRYSAFVKITVSEFAITLEQPGEQKNQIVLSRHLFQSDEDWSQAIVLVRESGLPSTGA